MKVQRDEDRPVSSGMMPGPGTSSGINVWLPMVAVTVTLAGVAAALIFLGDAGGLWALALPALLGVLLVVWSYRPSMRSQQTQEVRPALSGGAEPIVPWPDPATTTEPATTTTEPATTTTEPTTANQAITEAETAEAASTAEPVREKPVEPPSSEPTAGGRAGLLRTDWQELLHGRGVAVALDEELWTEACRRLRMDATERGGVALTVRGEQTLLVFGMVFPAQTHANSVRCEFSAGEVDKVRAGINAVADELSLPPGMVTVTWVHTHPRLGVFLSGTDVATSAKWRSLDPGFTPIVLDVHQATLADQVGVFGTDSKRLHPVVTVNGLVKADATKRIAESIDGVYRGEGSQPPLIVMRAWQNVPDREE